MTTQIFVDFNKTYELINSILKDDDKVSLSLEYFVKSYLCRGNQEETSSIVKDYFNNEGCNLITDSDVVLDLVSSIADEIKSHFPTFTSYGNTQLHFDDVCHINRCGFLIYGLK